MRVLVVEDYAPVREAVVQALVESDYAVDEAADGATGLWLARTNEHDAIVLDVMLPKLSGIEIVRTLRKENFHLPVILLTALDAVEQRVDGLDAGADDYLVKPFAMEELLARLRVLVRRKFGQLNSVLQVGELSVDVSARSVSVASVTLELTAGEYKLLELLAHRRGQVVTRSEIWQSLYDMNSETTSNVVDVYVGYLRRKLKDVGLEGYIETRRGLGYLLREPEK